MTLKESLMTIKDFRIDRCKKHNLCDILMIVLIGYLTGCKDMEEIHFSAEVSEEMLRKYLELPNGIPSTDTILRVLHRLRLRQGHSSFRRKKNTAPLQSNF